MKVDDDKACFPLATVVIRIKAFAWYIIMHLVYQVQPTVIQGVLEKAGMINISK